MINTKNWRGDEKVVVGEREFKERVGVFLKAVRETRTKGVAAKKTKGTKTKKNAIKRYVPKKVRDAMALLPESIRRRME